MAAFKHAGARQEGQSAETGARGAPAGNRIDHPLYWEPSIAFLRWSAAFLLIGTAAFEIVLLSQPETETSRKFIDLVLMLVAAATWFLLARGKVEAAVQTLGAGVWGYITIASYFLGGVNSTVIIIYPVTILLAGWLGGRRYAFVVAFLSSAVTLGFVIGDSLGALPDAYRTTPAMRWLIQVFVFLFCAFLISQVVRSYRNRLKEVRGLAAELAEHAARLEIAEGDLRYAQGVAGIGSWVCEFPGGSTRLTAEAARIFGLPEGADLAREDLFACLHPEDRAGVDRAWRALLEEHSPFDEEHRVQTPGGLRWVRHKINLERIHDGEPLRAVGTVQDVTEKKAAESQLERLAHYDALTGLPNRALLHDRMRQATARADREQTMFALIFLDLDQFKVINDRLGHAAGDEVLQEAARRVLLCLRATDTVARLGGDEFTLLLEDIHHVDEVAAVARKILDSLADLTEVGGREVHVSASIGATIYPLDDRDVQTLLKNADIAMYQAKREGRNNFQFFAPAMGTRAERQAEVRVRLRNALERGEFSLHYQPQVRLGDGAIVGVEALLRWTDSALGPVSPGEFIPVAEEMGLIVPVGDWVLREACRQCKAWLDAGLAPLRVSVNLSPRQFRQKTMAHGIAAILQETGLPATCLEVEITEGIVMKQADRAIRTLNELNRLGVQIAIDDFGTGYSSLAYLERFPVHVLKIDQSFVQAIQVGEDQAPIVNTVIQLARQLGLAAVAEGVETAGQRDYLRAQGCDLYQGYLFCYPQPAARIGELLAANRRAAASART